jgi:transcriptional regulator with XRE-family HTH domain
MGDTKQNEAWKQRIGARIRELREAEGWSLTDLSKRTGDTLLKSTISNWEQGTRMPGPVEATILGTAFDVSPAHILCLDDEMPVLSKDEAELIRNIRALPENQRNEYGRRIAGLAMAYREPVTDERVNETGFHPGTRGKRKVTPYEGDDD